jgi:murein DD-endopeptidase MepM/ murein hydrolase activator NlpD
LRSYTVRAGDTLYEIAMQHGLRLATVMWANGLTGTLIRVGQVLRLPPVDGTIVTVQAGDTVESIAAAAGVDPIVVAEYNGLGSGPLTVGQILIVPGGRGPAIVFPTPAPTRAPAARAPASSGFKPLFWPVAGGRISQQFGCTGFWAEPAYGTCAHYHGGIDIAAPSGTPIRAAAGGRVKFAGHKSDGGGNQACIDNGGGYTTCYHHMVSLAISTGQSVVRGQVIGGVGSTGNSTGPHLHFEIWIGPVWAGGYRVDPLDYF